MRGIFSRLLGLAIIVLVGLALAGAAGAQTQPRGAAAPVAGQQTPMSPGTTGSTTTPRGNNAVLPGSLPTAAAPDTNGGNAVAATGGPGICQCIADRTTRNLSCVGSAAECQSACASTHFAYTPHAIYSCAAPGASSTGASAGASPGAPRSASAATSSAR